mmetsp:Transcript_740/g.2112  ORF Transcript_740/g.2112 Transcript_740/m.2112 type:complete len:203 (-) Transcript_740:55-663(-)
MALMAFSHGHAGAIPVSILGLGLLVLVKAAWTERCAQIDLVLCQSLDDDRGDGFIGAQQSVSVFEVGVGKGRHGLERLFDGNIPFLLAHVIGFEMKRGVLLSDVGLCDRRGVLRSHDEGRTERDCGSQRDEVCDSSLHHDCEWNLTVMEFIRDCRRKVWCCTGVLLRCIDFLSVFTAVSPIRFALLPCLSNALVLSRIACVL